MDIPSYAHDYIVRFSVYSEKPNHRDLTTAEILAALHELGSELTRTTEVGRGEVDFEQTYNYETGEYTNKNGGR